MDMESRDVNNCMVGLFLILFVLFVVPVLDLLFQYLQSFGQGMNMKYLAAKSIKMFLLSKYTVQRIILFIIDGIMAGILFYLYKKNINQIIRYLFSLESIRNNDTLSKGDL